MTSMISRLFLQQHGGVVILRLFFDNFWMDCHEIWCHKLLFGLDFNKLQADMLLI